MSQKTVFKSVLRYIDEISIREFRFAVLVCVFIAAVNALIVAYSLGYGHGRVVCGYPCYFPGPHESFHDFMRVKIELALLIIATSLWFRRVLGFLISLLATMFVGYQYGLWYLDTQRWLREIGVSDFSELPVPGEFPHFAGLYRATPWDIALLVIVTALFAWQVRVLIALISSARQHKQPE